MSKSSVFLLVLLGAHLALGIGRIPGKVMQRRLAEIEQYQQKGAARFLLEDAKLQGANELEWVLANTDKDSVILWRWPSKGALEFAAAVLAPRLVVDERLVKSGATKFAGRTIATGTPPTCPLGLITLQGTKDEGLRLITRVN